MPVTTIFLVSAATVVDNAATKIARVFIDPPDGGLYHASGVHARDAVDLDFPPAAQDGLNRGARRIIAMEKLAIDAVHGIEIVEVREMYGDLDDIFETAVRRFQNLRDIGQFEAGLG